MNGKKLKLRMWLCTPYIIASLIFELNFWFNLVCGSTPCMRDLSNCEADKNVCKVAKYHTDMAECDFSMSNVCLHVALTWWHYCVM